ncbi:MAG: hypothetical protein QN130_12300 [Armatimonadota bacterium]|nr:hypothetical protein [Armatimonadota bacterium]
MPWVPLHVKPLGEEELPTWLPGWARRVVSWVLPRPDDPTGFAHPIAGPAAVFARPLAGSLISRLATQRLIEGLRRARALLSFEGPGAPDVAITAVPETAWVAPTVRGATYPPWSTYTKAKYFGTEPVFEGPPVIGMPHVLVGMGKAAVTTPFHELRHARFAPTGVPEDPYRVLYTVVPEIERLDRSWLAPLGLRYRLQGPEEAAVEALAVRDYLLAGRPQVVPWLRPAETLDPASELLGLSVIGEYLYK